MQIKTDGKRNIKLPETRSRQKIILKDINGETVSYIKTGNNNARITGTVPDVVFAEFEEIPLRPVNVGALNIAKTLDLTDEMNLVLEKQNAIRQAFGAVLDFKSEIENKFLQNKEQTDIALSELAEIARNTGLINDKRYEETRGVDLAQSEDITKIYSICNDLLSKANALDVDVANIMSVLASHEHEKQTKESLGLGSVDNTRDADKPISIAVQDALDDKVSKDELTEFAEYIKTIQKRQGEIENGIQSLGGISSNPIPTGGKEGYVLTKRSSLDGDFWWTEPAVGGQATEEKLGVSMIATTEEALQGTDNTKIMTPVKVKAVVSTESSKLTAKIDANTDAIVKTKNELNNGISAVQGDLDKLESQVSGIEEKIPQNASATNQLATKSDIEAIPKFKVVVVASLPAIGEEKTIYLVPKDGKPPDVHDEYLWINNKFELIGNTEIDLSEYAKKTYVDESVAEKTTVIWRTL